MLDVIKRKVRGRRSPHHFESVDEVIATSTGSSRHHGLTLDESRGRTSAASSAQNSVCFYPELQDIFYNSNFFAQVKAYWGAEYAKPTMMLFNICGPHDTGLARTSTR